MLIADTGFWLALANRRDRHHERAKQCLDALDEGLITTWPVMTETCHMLLSRLGVDAQTRFMQSLAKGAFEVFDLPLGKAASLAEMMRQYDNLPMDLADASLVLLAESLGHGRILSTDQRDFGAYRWKQHQPFENLLIV